MKQIIHVFDVNAAPDKVFQALTTQQGLASWWTTNVSGEFKIGGRIQFGFAGFGPQMEVTRLEPNQAVRWKCVGGVDDWISNTFSFDIKETDGTAHVTFKQDYAKELSDDVYGSYNYNWGFFMESLRLYCDTGTGKPYQASTSSQ